MKKYLEELKNELEKENISNKDEIFKKYEDRYNFGLEAGLSDEEIEEMLGDIDDIIEKYKEAEEEINENLDNEENKAILYVKVLRDDVVVRESKDDECHIYFENTKSSYYDVTNSKSKGVIVNYHKNMVLTLNKVNGKITIEIPRYKKFKSCEFNFGSADADIMNLNAKKISIVASQGDIKTKDLISSGDLSIHCVNADIECDKLECVGELHITNVSGDIDVDNAKASYIKIDTVSGDIKLKNADGKIDSKSISGDVHVNGEDFSNLKKNIGRMFR